MSFNSQSVKAHTYSFSIPPSKTIICQRNSFHFRWSYLVVYFSFHPCAYQSMVLSSICIFKIEISIYCVHCVLLLRGTISFKYFLFSLCSFDFIIKSTSARFHSFVFDNCHQTQIKTYQNDTQNQLIILSRFFLLFVFCFSQTVEK